MVAYQTCFRSKTKIEVRTTKITAKKFHSNRKTAFAREIFEPWSDICRSASITYENLLVQPHWTEMHRDEIQPTIHSFLCLLTNGRTSMQRRFLSFICSSSDSNASSDSDRKRNGVLLRSSVLLPVKPTGTICNEWRNIPLMIGILHRKETCHDHNAKYLKLVQ